MLNMRVESSAEHLRGPTLTEPGCCLCGARLHRTLIDLGNHPLANRTVAADTTTEDKTYRLHARICDSCTLVQVANVAPPAAITTPKPFFLSNSAVYLGQARRHADILRKRLHLDADSLVIEIGSNDGYLLRHFQAAGIPVLGVEPAPAAAAAAAEIGIPTEICVFNTETAMEIAVRHGCADLVVVNNALPHAPDLFDFAAGIASLLRPNAVLTLQMPHLLSLVQQVQFDAFRHDCYTYLSLRVLEHVLRSVGLRAFDAEHLPDRGGSLRVYACHVGGPYQARPGLRAVRLAEGSGEPEQRKLCSGFSNRVTSARIEIQDFLRTRRAAGRHVAAYGAATRGSSLLNYCDITTNEIACVADQDVAKHGRLMPGSRIPIVPMETLLVDPPDDVVILPWPSATEIALKLMPLQQGGTQLWTVVPRIARV